MRSRANSSAMQPAPLPVTFHSRPPAHAPSHIERSGAMNETPERLFTGDSGVARLNALIHALDDEEQVRLTLDDGRTIEGVVAARPALQVFRPDDGDEGYNALLRLEPLAGEAPPHYLWLDRIVEVFRLGSA
jgi:hypothetical protein